MSRNQFAHCVRTIAVAGALCGLSLIAGVERTHAHEGHDHGEETPAITGAPASPRVVATSERYQFVGIVEGEVLVIYLDRAEDNAPVTTATVEVSLNGEVFKAERQEKTGTYEVTAPLLRKAGSHEVLVSLADGNASDLLVGTLKIPSTASNVAGRRSFSQIITDDGMPIVGHGDFGKYFFGPLTKDLWRLSLGLGYRWSENLVAKVEYTIERGELLNGTNRDEHDFVGAEIGFQF